MYITSRMPTPMRNQMPGPAVTARGPVIRKMTDTNINNMITQLMGSEFHMIWVFGRFVPTSPLK